MAIPSLIFKSHLRNDDCMTIMSSITVLLCVGIHHLLKCQPASSLLGLIILIHICQTFHHLHVSLLLSSFLFWRSSFWFRNPELNPVNSQPNKDKTNYHHQQNRLGIWNRENLNFPNYKTNGLYCPKLFEIVNL